MATTRIGTTHWNVRETLPGEIHLGAEFEELKKSILKEYGEANIRKSWITVTSALAQEAQVIRSEGSNIIPEVDFSQLDNTTTAQILEIKKRGVLVVRNIFTQEKAREWQAHIDKYLKENKELFPGFPSQNPWQFRSYFSPVQNEVRSDPRSLKVQDFINKLWHGYDPDESLPTPLVYADSLRHRRPGGFSHTVQPHIDAGSLDRWADGEYRKVYASIFGGDPLSHDAYDIRQRELANFARFPGQQQSSVLRSFQGWTSLSTSGGAFGRSSLAVFPNVTLAISYILLRPFFKAPEGQPDAPPETWELDLSDTFQGAAKGFGQKIFPETHAHLQLEETLVLTPVINPGDAVFWHSDVIHAVDPILTGEEAATVLYIPAVPLTRKNLKYVRAQRESFKDNGRIPPDFERWGLQFEGTAKGWDGVAEVQNDEARQSWGLSKLQGSSGIIAWANEVLGYA